MSGRDGEDTLDLGSAEPEPVGPGQAVEGQAAVLPTVSADDDVQTMSSHVTIDMEGDGEDRAAITAGATMADLAHPNVTRKDGPKSERPTRVEDDPASLDDKIRQSLEAGPREKKDPLLGATLGGRFLVLKKIGAGGMGAVYRARQEGMDRDVAVKVLLGDLAENDTVLRRFTLEALAVSRLRHPNTIQIFDYGQTPQGNPYIAMELLEGQTLHDLLRQERPLPIRRALRIMDQVSASLAEAHGKGIVHRDLKPENIFLVQVGDNADYVKVLDFGVAKLRDHKQEQGTLTQAGSIFGTPRYMSPEQCSAQPVDNRSDLYALGVILYEMITGQAPFQNDQALSLLLAHVNEPPPPPSSVTDKQVIPAEVEDLVLKLLEKLPEHRLQEAGDLAKQCHELAEALPSAFDSRVGTAEAESLGVRVASTTMDFPTARTMRLGLGGQARAGSSAPGLEAPPVAPRSKLVVPLVAVGGAGLVALVAALALREPQVIEKVVTEKVEVPVAVPTPVAATRDPNVVRITVNSRPPGAQVLHGGKLLGTTNLTLEHARGGPGEDWQLLREGSEPATVHVEFGEARVYQVDLKPRTSQPLAAAPVPAQPTVAKPKSAKPDSKPEPLAAKPEPKPEPAVVKPELKAEPKVEPKVEKKPPKDDRIDDLQ